MEPAGLKPTAAPSCLVGPGADSLAGLPAELPPPADSSCWHGAMCGLPEVDDLEVQRQLFRVRAGEACGVDRDDRCLGREWRSEFLLLGDGAPTGEADEDEAYPVRYLYG